MSDELRNYLDASGAPVCPVCGQVVDTHRGIARVDDCIVHAACLGPALDAEDPCEPSQV
jgi:hypothetical protein